MHLPADTEAGLQQVVVEGLRLLGFSVLVTTRHPKRCRCGRWSRADDGASRGLPDLLVTRPSWEGLWLALEVKRPAPGRARLSPEQQLLYSAGAVIVVRSVEAALNACQDVGMMFNALEQRLAGDPDAP
jgi:hypothetical protein